MMRRTLKNMLFAMGCMLLSSTMACADNSKPLQKRDLPATVQTLLATHFNQQRIAHASRETGIGDNDYDVVLQNGTKLEFDEKGNWTEIDCKRGKVPAALIPQKIRAHVQNTYPGQYITKIERQRKCYEVELSSGIELTFSKQFKLVDVD